MQTTHDGKFILPERTHCRVCRQPATLASISKPDRNGDRWVVYVCAACATKTKNAKFWKDGVYALGD